MSYYDLQAKLESQQQQVQDQLTDKEANDDILLKEDEKLEVKRARSRK